MASYDSSGRLTSDYLITVSVVTGDDVTGGVGSSVQTLTLQAGAYTSQTTTYDTGTGTGTTTTGGYSFIDQEPDHHACGHRAQRSVDIRR